MKLRGLSHLLCALALLIAQSFAVLHATQHELTGGGSEIGCDACALAHASAPPATAAMLPATVYLRVAEAALSPTRSPVLRPTARPRSRAPPAFLC